MSDLELVAMCDVSAGTRGLARDYEKQLAAAARPLIQACDACQHVQFPPMLRCPRCGSAGLAWVDGGATGRISTFVTVYAEEATPGYSLPGRLASRTPYTTLFVALDEHPGVRIPALLADGDAPPLTGTAPAVSLTVSAPPRPVVMASTR
jgi:uncharacterized OB-fold protein